MSEKLRKQQSFQYGAAILLSSTILVKLIGAVFKIPLSSDICLGDLGFGYFSSAYDLFTPIYALAMAGLPIAVARVVAVQVEQKRFKDVRKSLSITRKLFFVAGTTAFLLMLALIYPFVKLTDSTGETSYSLFAIAPSLIFCCVMSTYRGYYEGLRNMYPTAISDIIEALGKLILGFGFAFATVKITGNTALGAAAAMLGITVGTMISALYLAARYRIKGDLITESELASSPPPLDTKIATKAIIIIAIPIVLSSLANNIASLVDVTMVKWQITRLMADNSSLIREMYAASIEGYNSFANSELTTSQIPTFLYGIRGKAFTLYNLVPTLTSVLGVSALPVLASSWACGDRSLIKKNIESMLKLMALITFPAACGLFALSSPIMNLLYSSTASVQIGGPILRIFGLAALFAGIAIPITSMLQAVGKQMSALRNIAIGAAIKIAVNFFAVGIPEINIKGAAYGTLACYVFIFLSNFISLCLSTKIFPDLTKVFLKPFVAAVCCAAAAYVFSGLGFTKHFTILSIFVALVVYVVMLILLNSFEQSDILNLPKGEKLLRLCLKYRIIR